MYNNNINLYSELGTLFPLFTIRKTNYFSS